jgi:membrane associated rhomboid family serine protease
MNSYRSSFLNSIPPVVKNLIAINIVLWLASIVVPGIFMKWGLNVDLTDILGLHYWESSKFNPAQLITYAFMHGGLAHIFFNMFALYMFGGVLEQLWGTKRFLFYYLITGVGAGLVQELFWTVQFHSVIAALNEGINANSGQVLLKYQDVLGHYFRLENLGSFNAPAIIEMKKMFLDSPSFITIGASGSVFGLLLAFGWLFPEVRLMMLFIPIPIKARVFVLFYGIAELFLGVAQFSGDNIAHFAHLGGMLFGAILILMWKKKKTY